jgi:outer membrane protein OmpA-like peptidoglycan-associated protein
LKITRMIVALSAIVALSLVQAGTREASAVAAPQVTTVPSMVSRSTKAVNYRHAGGSTRIGFQGTDLAPNATGDAKVQSRTNRIDIDAKFLDLPDSSRFGLEYLTYVLWAISPQGRAVNLGEIRPEKDGSGKLKASTEMQTFGMIVTAEPYYAVTQPGDEVVLENSISKSTISRAENIDAKYQLIGRGSYGSANTKIEDAIFGVDRKAPQELFQARNAVRIAHNAQADKYAASTMAKADSQLKNAEQAYSSGGDKKRLIAMSRNVVETAEEARVIAVQKKTEEDAQMAADAERRAAAQREADARAQADAEAAGRAQAERDRQQADAARADAERMRAQATDAQQQAERDRQAAEAARAAAIAQQQAAQADADAARQAAAQAEKDKADMRAQLLAQLNSILQTQDTARGLIVNMSDVLFDTGKYTLKPGAREKLAKISGIVLAHPGLNLQIEGYTDSVGSDQFNQTLSEQRASAVRDYLVQNGVAAASVTAKGFGKADPVATNDTAEGRQRNRRVQLVVTGDVIGKTATSPDGSPQ